MSLSMHNVSVFIPTGSPDAELVAQRCLDAGARVHTGDSAAAMEVPRSLGEPVGLVVLPAGTPQTTADAVVDRARTQGIPINNLGGRRQHNGEHHKQGAVTLVGGGPGNPELITVAGRKAVLGADIIFADHLGPFALAEEAAERGAELVDVSKQPYGKQLAQEKTTELMLQAARAGKKVVRLKGGDPFIFGRGLEEAEACTAAGVPVSVIPGVTSVTSAPALGGVSLTHRGLVHDVTIVSGHVPPGHQKSLVNWPAVAALTGTLVLIMAVKNAGAIAAELLAHGRSTDQAVSIIESASGAHQRITDTTLANLGEDIETKGIKAPAIIVIGKVSGRRLAELAASAEKLTVPAN